MNYVKTIWALLPPVIAIIFALKTKEVYISLLIGVVSGTLLLTNFHLVETLNSSVISRITLPTVKQLK
jgi:tetracycline resistance efflux pump